MTSNVQAARERLERADPMVTGRTYAGGAIRADDLRTILSALTAAEERAATAERERDEARVLAEDRLEALRPFARLAGTHTVASVEGVTISNGSRMCGAESAWFHRAAALTSEADHGGSSNDDGTRPA